MNNANIKSMIREEQWSLLYQFLKKEIHIVEEHSAKKELIDIFESIDEVYKSKFMIDLYGVFWRWSLDFGKVKLAKKYLITLIDHLIKYKKIPELRRILPDAKKILPKEEIEKFNFVEVILGKRHIANEEEFHSVRMHPELWKSSKDSLKSYLLTDAHWDLSSWKLIYEYFLRYNYDKEIVTMLAERNLENRTSTSKAWNEKFQELYRAKKINTKSLQWQSAPAATVESYTKSDLDKIALDLLSGEQSDQSVNQDVLISSLKMMGDEEIIKNGKEMIVAFSFLGMEKVVIYICDELLKVSDEIKEKVALYYSISQSLYACGQFHRAIDVATDTLLNEALLRDEKAAFKYLIGECYLNLKNPKRAREFYAEVYRINPSFRLVEERLRTIE